MQETIYNALTVLFILSAVVSFSCWVYVDFFSSTPTLENFATTNIEDTISEKSLLLKNINELYKISSEITEMKETVKSLKVSNAIQESQNRIERLKKLSQDLKKQANVSPFGSTAVGESINIGSAMASIPSGLSSIYDKYPSNSYYNFNTVYFQIYLSVLHDKGDLTDDQYEDFFKSLNA